MTRSPDNLAPVTDAGDGGSRWGRRSLVFAIGAVVFFFLALSLHAVGADPNTTENREPAPFPSSFASWKVVDETLAPTEENETDFVELPPLGPIPSATGSSAVVLGTDGWLFLTADFAGEPVQCSIDDERDSTISGLKRFARILTDSGRRFAMTVAPDKSTAEPEHLQDGHPYGECIRDGRSLLEAFRRAGIPGYVDMDRVIRRGEKRDGVEYWSRLDSHWNGHANTQAAIRLMKQVAPEIAATATTRLVTSEREGELTRLLGTGETERVESPAIRRDGVTTTTTEEEIARGLDARTCRAKSTNGEPLLPGKTLIIGDSFGAAVLQDLCPLTKSVRWLNLVQTLSAPRTTAEQIAAADTVFVVDVERVIQRSGLGLSWWGPFLDKLEPMLRATS